MKRIIFSVIFATALATSVFAQHGDSVFFNLHDTNYYTNYDESLFDSINIVYNGPAYEIFTELRYTESPLVVYGIAISVVPPEFFAQNALDTNIGNWVEHARLYKPGTDGSMELLGEGDYSVFSQASKYLPTMILRTPQADTITRLPVYETYFNDVAVVTDSFYIGTTEHNSCQVNSTELYSYGYRSHIAMLVYKLLYPIESVPHSIFRYSYDNNSWHWSTQGFTLEQYYQSFVYSYSTATIVCYPILSPDPNRDTLANPYHYPWDTAATDTTHVDTTQSAIATARLLERYVNVYPTVTDGGAVTVMSSFHLESVEVYDAAGRMVSRQPASGVATSIDVSQLPAGYYVLRINTVSGSTTKKFVRR